MARHTVLGAVSADSLMFRSISHDNSHIQKLAHFVILEIPAGLSLVGKATGDKALLQPTGHYCAL